jgi:Heat shock protein. Metallo peptidase. MEROPS family M48B
MYHATPVTEAEYPELYSIVRNLAVRGNIPMPKVYIVDEDTPNAFATGRNPQHAAVCVTTGIMRILNANELSGVIGHELTHVKNRDILISSIAATVAGAISMLAWMAEWGAMFGGFRRKKRRQGRQYNRFNRYGYTRSAYCDDDTACHIEAEGICRR